MSLQKLHMIAILQKMGYEFFKDNGKRFFEMIENDKIYLISMSSYFSTEEDVVINNEKEKK